MQARRVVLWLLLVLLTPWAAGAQVVPNLLPYEGVLKDGQGAPIDGTVAMRLGIWTSEIEGRLLYEEDHAAVDVDQGVFSVDIGSGTPTIGAMGWEIFASTDRFLEAVVDGELLSPRQRIASVPFAMVADVAASAAIRGWKSVFRGVEIPADTSATWTVDCGSGFVVLGGGFSAPSTSAQLQQSYPSSRRAWTIRLANTNLFSSLGANAWAACAFDGGG